MNRVVHFELNATDPAAALKFYEAVFGWKAQKWQGPEEYWLLTSGEGDGIDGGLMKSRDGQPRTVNTIRVDSVDDYTSKIEQAGGTIVVPMFPIPGVGYVAYATDPGGVLIGVMHEDRDAK